MKLLVTGGAGFIGSAVVRQAIAVGCAVVNVDCLTYAANLANVASVADDPGYAFAQVDIRDGAALRAAFEAHDPDAVIHLAAETHVDRSIDGPAAFVSTNVEGTCALLEAARAHWSAMTPARRERFRFLHVSTDEVYGALGPEGRFTETSRYAPNSPYAASKAGSDHLARAWQRTYGLPVVVTNCSNNYGPYQFPEKLIPVAVLKGMAGLPIPVYGRGENVRDWLYVDDHAEALLCVLERGRIGETYNIGGGVELRNIDLVERICAILDRRRPEAAPHARLVSFVTDRPGHDFRYAIDPAKVVRELGWTPRHDIETGLAATVDWHADNEAWWRPLLARPKVGERLGLPA